MLIFSVHMHELMCVCFIPAFATPADSANLLSLFQNCHFILGSDRVFHSDELYSCFTDKHKLPLIFECSAEVGTVL